MFRRSAAILVIVAMACGDADDAPPDDGGPGDSGATDAGSLPPPEVGTPSGTVRGGRGRGYQEFLGIPYARPPVGDRRWRPPEPHPGWDDVLDATERPSACAQRAFGLSTGSEDCLYLNVHTPDPRPTDAPVMVWIHGGAFIFGEGVQTEGGTRGDILAADHGVVVVSVNYRLGPFGFLGHPALSGENGGGSGNWGIADQVEALRWVRDHIASFGGDPENVTLFGESAGGLSVCLHLMHPGSAGLFHRAISQSGLCDAELPTLADAEVEGASYAARLGCDAGSDPLACMREADEDAIFEADVGPTGMTAITAGRTWWPNVDGDVVPGQLRDRVGADDFNRVPTIVGWNGDEGTLFVMLAEQDGVAIDEAAYREGIAALAAEHGLDAADVEARYPLSDYPDPGAALADAMGHAVLACPSRRAAELLSAEAETRVYRFEYEEAPFQLPSDRELGAFHSAEIQYVFGHSAALGRSVHTGDDLVLHGIVSGYWTRYARDGDPDGDGVPSWPTWDPSGDRHLVLDLDPRVDTAADRDDCALWDR